MDFFVFEERMEKMKEKTYLALGITLVLLTFVGVSLAYFLTTIEGDRKILQLIHQI